MQNNFDRAFDCLSEAEEIFVSLQSPLLELVQEKYQEVLYQKVPSIVGDERMKELIQLFKSGKTDEANRLIAEALGLSE